MIVVMGTPGAGKSTVIKEFRKRNPKVKVVNFGTVMHEIAKEEFGIKDRDEMRKLNRDQFRLLQSMAVNKILRMGNDLIIDTHASIKTSDGYHPGFPYYVLSKLPVRQYIYIRAPICDIISRRKRDTTRKRDRESESDLRFHEQINISMVSAYATHSNAPIKFIYNEDGKLEEAIKEFEECVRL